MGREQRTEHHLLPLEPLQEAGTTVEVIEVKEVSALSPVPMPLSAASLKSCMCMWSFCLLSCPGRLKPVDLNLLSFGDDFCHKHTV